MKKSHAFFERMNKFINQIPLFAVKNGFENTLKNEKFKFKNSLKPIQNDHIDTFV